MKIKSMFILELNITNAVNYNKKVASFYENNKQFECIFVVHGIQTKFRISNVIKRESF